MVYTDDMDGRCVLFPGQLPVPRGHRHLVPRRTGQYNDCEHGTSHIFP